MRRPKTRGQAVAYLTYIVARTWAAHGRATARAWVQLGRNTGRAYWRTWVDWTPETRP